MHQEGHFVAGERCTGLGLQYRSEHCLGQPVELPDFDSIQLVTVHVDARQANLATDIEVERPETQVASSKIPFTVVHAQIVQADIEGTEPIEEA